MKALVVYESLFGNTEQVARAITTGLSKYMEVDLRDVSDAPPEITDFLDLIVVGGPTHAFSMSRPNTREDAFRQGATQGRRELGLREWLGHLRSGPHSEMLATFDTKVDKVRHLPGSAAKGAAKVARKHGYSPSRTESFYVADVSGPLLEGELDRAEAWGERLAVEADARASGSLGR
jgi:hypothetical protein